MTPPHPLVELARRAIEHYLRSGEALPPPEPLPPEMARRAGAFVSLKKGGDLRGCVGTAEPREANVAAEVIRNAIAAASRDPRFPPLALGELAEVSVSVDVVAPLESVLDSGELDPKRYGVLVRWGGLQGVLLPDLPAVRTVEEQLAIVRKKAGIPEGEPCEVFRFTVERFREDV
ncbi:MAG: AmmeMemoRadiSam system protein A [Nitrospinota bacterium]